MSPADRRPAAKDFGVYLITDRHQTAGRLLTDVVEQALRGGVRAVQLRERDLDTRALLALAQALRTVTARHGAALLINDRIDVALACEADGVHLPADSFAVSDARSLLGPTALIGVSTHAPDDVRRAASADADLVVFGPVFDTPSKRRYGPPVGIGALAEAVRVAPIPVYALGGVTATKVPDLLRTDIAGVAVISAVIGADDPQRAAAELIAALQRSS